MSSYDDIYDVVCMIPEGRVATYGQIARLAGRPNGARQVGYALAALGSDHEVPWYRVINAQGKVSLRATPGYEDYQQILLEDEGVEFSLTKVVNLKRFQWEA